MLETTNNINKHRLQDPNAIVSSPDVPIETLRVLAGAQSLHMTDQFIGDPLEISIMENIEWSMKAKFIELIFFSDFYCKDIF